MSKCRDLLTLITQRSIHTTYATRDKTPKNLKGKNITAQNWLRRQINDPYTQRARFDNFRCRSAFKLLEIDDKHKILRPGQVVVDCGAAPGSWTQVAVQRVNALGSDNGKPTGKVISVDLQHMIPVDGATMLNQADFTKIATQKKILDILGGKKVDIVISDMAPKATGIKSMDHDLIIELCVSALKFSHVVLQDGGTFVCKLWQGGRAKQLEVLLKRLFLSVKTVKPDASRSDSAEMFFMARKFIGKKDPNS